ncbi:MAG: hypothetical protein U5K75_00240 [Ahrensia sp.]|nr:hypothetical protein [Ahrensia sp.]
MLDLPFLQLLAEKLGPLGLVAGVLFYLYRDVNKKDSAAPYKPQGFTAEQRLELLELADRIVERLSK